MRITFLGTSAARPTVERNVSSLCISRQGETLMFDCGEGTQRQMMRYGVSFNLSDIFVTHYHADHYLGIAGLVRTLALQGREEPLHLWGPRGARRVLGAVLGMGAERLTFNVEITELGPGDRLDRGEYEIIPYRARHHGNSALGYALVEKERLGRFDPARAREIGVPEGPLWGRLHRGQNVELADGRVVTPDELVGPPRAGRRVVYTGDSAACAETVEIAHEADVLIHDATFLDEERERARETDHATALEAAQVALAARARMLVLTHLSARYSAYFFPLLEEARSAFPNSLVAKDGLEIEVEYPDGVITTDVGAGTG